jgi:hypothetical protein
MVNVNGKYLVSGRYVKVVNVTDDHIEVVWGYNGQKPVRKCDRYLSVKLIPHFKPV